MSPFSASSLLTTIIFCCPLFVTSAARPSDETTKPAAPDPVNLLSNLTIPNDFIGKWQVTPDGFKTDGIDVPRIQFDVTVPQEYDFIIEFTRLGGAGPVHQNICYGSSDLNFVMAVAPQMWFGLGKIDGKTVETNKTGVRLPTSLVNGVRHTARVEVRKNSIVGYFNGERVCGYSGDASRVSLPSHLNLNKRCLGFAVEAAAILHSATLVPVITNTPAVERKAARPDDGQITINPRNVDSLPPLRVATEADLALARASVDGRGFKVQPSVAIEQSRLILNLKLLRGDWKPVDAYNEAAIMTLRIYGDNSSLDGVTVRWSSAAATTIATNETRREWCAPFIPYLDDTFQIRRAAEWWPKMRK